jgi:hypothetical protein
VIRTPTGRWPEKARLLRFQMGTRNLSGIGLEAMCVTHVKNLSMFCPCTKILWEAECRVMGYFNLVSRQLSTQVVAWMWLAVFKLGFH